MLKIGEIIGSHGVRGEVKVYPYTDNPQRFFDMGTVDICQGTRCKKMTIDGVRCHKNIFLFSFQRINNRTEADSLRGWDLMVEYDDAVQLPKGHYYDHQLEGMEVYDVDTQMLLGVIERVLHLPANAVYEVKSEQNNVLVPALKQVVKKIDVPNRRMYILPLEGLWE